METFGQFVFAGSSHYLYSLFIEANEIHIRLSRIAAFVASQTQGQTQTQHADSWDEEPVSESPRKISFHLLHAWERKKDLLHKLFVFTPSVLTATNSFLLKKPLE